MMIQRKVAYASVGGSLSDFNKFWPVKGAGERETFVLDADMREKILAAHPTIKKQHE